MKTLKILFFTIIATITILFLTLINSTVLTSKAFEYLSQELPIKYSKVEGTLYTGIKISDLNYDEMVKAQSIYIKPSLLALLLKQIYIYDLKVEKISFENKFFEFLKANNIEKKEQNGENFEIPFSLFVKNFELNLENFVYEEQKIDELVLKSKDISSNLKDLLSAEIFATIKSNIANLEANINLDENKYKVDSKIELKNYIEKESKNFILNANGDLKKVDFKLQNDFVTINKEKQKIDFENLLLVGDYDIEKSNLQISTLDSKFKYDKIVSDIKAKALMQNNDINTLNFDINLLTTVKKDIYKAIQKDLQLKSNLIGNLKEIKFSSNLEQNLINIEKTAIKIDSLTLDGLAKIKDKNIDVLADFNLKTNLANKKSKIDLKLNLDKIDDLTISAKSLIQNLNYENYNLKPIGDLSINSFYKKNSLSVDLSSKIANLTLKSDNLKRFIFDLNIKELNPNNFYELDKSLKISSLKGNIKAEYQENLFANANLTLNNSFVLNADFKTQKDNFEAKINSNSFDLDIQKTADLIKVKTNIKELRNLEKELNKIAEIPTLNLSGLVNLDLQILSNDIHFELNSPKISYENESLEDVDIKGNLKDELLNFQRLNFVLGKAYDIDLQKKFTLLTPAHFNIKTFDGFFAFDNISLKTSKKDKNIVLNIITKDLLFVHGSYGTAILDSNLIIDIDQESKIFVQGELRAKNLKALYNIPAMNISKDRDIIIVSKNPKLIEKDFFLENVALELLVFADDIKYSVKNIDLKASTLLNLKKDFSKSLKIYGSVHDVKGNVSELGKTYTIKDSNIYFNGLEPIDPVLDIKASTKIEEVDILIIISGSLNNPRLNLSSNPVMNQKDILSYLIFGTTFSTTSKGNQTKQSQASLFLLNELSKDYAKEIGVDSIYFQFDPTTQFIETHIGKKIGEKNKVILKNKAQAGQIVFMREFTKLWNVELGFEENTQSIDFTYKKRY